MSQQGFTLRRGKVQAKVRPVWRAIDHPRDSQGRFIETGAEVRIWGGAEARVVRSVGNGRIEVERPDGTRSIIHRNHLTVIKRPDGSEPTAERDDAPEPMPPEAPSQEAVVDEHLVEDPVERLAAVGGVPESVAGSPDDPADLILSSVLPPSAQEAAEDVARRMEGEPDPAPEPEDAEVEVMETTYDIREGALPAAIASIEQANRRAERAGIADRFSYTTEPYEVRHSDPLGGPDRIEVRHRLTLSRPTLSHDGWTFVGTMTWDEEAGLVTRVAPGATLRQRPEARQCDVCKAARDRRDTYVVQKGDEEIQVGSNCLQQFMGIRPAGLWMLGFEPEVNEGDGDEGGGGSTGESRLDSAQLLALGLAVVKAQGWVPRSRADERTPATADTVAFVLRGIPRTDDDRRFIEQMRAEAQGLHEEGQAVLDVARTIEGDNEYVTNLRAAATPDSVTMRNMPLLLSAISVKQRQEEQTARRKAEEQSAQQSDHVGKVKDKITDMPATVLGVRYIDGAYGTTTLLTFADGNGNIFKWFASGTKDDLAVGDEVSLSGTIKGHGEYRGVKETTLTRCKYKRSEAAIAADEARAKAAREAEERAEAERRAAYERSQNPAPEGYIAIEPETPLLPGTRVRVKGEYGSIYEDGIVLTAGREYAGRQMVMVRYIEGSTPRTTGTDRSRIVAVAPDSLQDPEMGASLVEEHNRYDPVPDGFTRRPVDYFDIAVGQTVRIPVNPNGGSGAYVNATVIAASGGWLTLRMPDGSERQMQVGSVVAYQ